MGRLSTRPAGEFWEEVRRKRAEGWFIKDLARWIAEEEVKRGVRPAPPRRIPAQTVRNWLAMVPPSIYEQVQPEEAPAEDLKQERKVQEAEAKASRYHRLYQQAVKELARRETLEEVMREVLAEFPPVRVRYKPPPLGAVGKEQVALALLGDVHAFEVIDRDAMAGLNEYNPLVLNRRLHLWANKIVQLVDLRRRRLCIDDLVLCLMGDMLSGQIHASLERTNAYRIVTSIGRLSYLLAQALLYLSSQFRKVRVVCLEDNHGRITKEPVFKEPVETFTHLLYQTLAFLVEKQSNIEFVIPRSFMHVMSVRGRVGLFAHGDAIRSWMGIPYYGIRRFFAEMREVLQARGIMYQDAYLAHFHAPALLPMASGWGVINGSFAGGDEFALKKLHAYSPPIQWLIHVHPEKGLNDFEPLYLAEADTDETLGFADALPDVWAEAMAEGRQLELVAGGSR